MRIAKALTLVCAILLLARATQGANWFLASWGNDTHSGTSASAPWISSAPLFTYLAPNDTVNFLRGSHWRGTFIVPSMSYVTFQAYGDASDALPIIDGTVEIAPSSWTQVGNSNVYVTNFVLPTVPVLRNQDPTIPSVVKTPPQIYYQGARQTLARYPNNVAPYDDRLFFWMNTTFPHTTTKNATYQQAHLPSGISLPQFPPDAGAWDGAILRGRNSNWLCRATIVSNYSYDSMSGIASFDLTSQNGDPFTFGNTNWTAWAGYVEGLQKFLDYPGEYWHDPVAHKLYFIAPDQQAPSSNMEVSVYSYGLFFSTNGSVSYYSPVTTTSITVQDLHLYGQAKSGIDFIGRLVSTSYWTFSRLVMDGMYMAGINMRLNVTNLTIIDNQVSNTLGEGVHIEKASYMYIVRNTFRNTGSGNALQTPSGLYNADAIFVDASTYVEVAWNNINHTGYCGIHVLAIYLYIHDNTVAYTHSMFTDGGLIYSANSYYGIYRFNNLSNPIGSSVGSWDKGVGGNGIYLDIWNSVNEMSYNTISHSAPGGVGIKVPVSNGTGPRFDSWLYDGLAAQNTVIVGNNIYDFHEGIRLQGAGNVQALNSAVVCNTVTLITTIAVYHWPLFINTTFSSNVYCPNTTNPRTAFNIGGPYENVTSWMSIMNEVGSTYYTYGDPRCFALSPQCAYSTDNAITNSLVQPTPSYAQPQYAYYTPTPTPTATPDASQASRLETLWLTWLLA